MRNLEKYYAFEMTEKGGPSAPKGIPFKSTAITYTIFVSNKQFKKLELDPEGFQHTKLLVQGEPTLDAPVDACPGETGVICMQIQVLPKKTDDKDKDAKQTDIKNKASQKTDTKSEDTQKKEYLPKGTEDVIPLDKIILGEICIRRPFQDRKNEIS
ncbi:hypothetical protein [Bacillus cereus]|uniref:hypothetical protein n=1 Tax=Bacillus cereus TaxID=1396 RepID=UPI001F5B184F|nr:hypothetical protein [Bacillus cereus]